MDFDRHQHSLLTEIQGHEACCFAQVVSFLWVGCAKRNILIFDTTVCFFSLFFLAHFPASVLHVLIA